MTRAELRDLVVRAVTDVAPDIDPESLRGDESLRVDLELDSMDFLTVVEVLSQETGLDIPEDAYSELTTVDACADYLSRAGAAR